jgi:hypothetical protein
MVHKFVVLSVKQTLHFEHNFTKLNYIKVKTSNGRRGWRGPKQVTLLSRMEILSTWAHFIKISKSFDAREKTFVSDSK